MWNVLAHEAARLPMIYAIAADLTGDRRWRELARRFGPEAATQSKGDSTKLAYALLQEQVSLESLYQLEDSPGLKRQWLEAMRLVSARRFGVPRELPRVPYPGRREGRTWTGGSGRPRTHLWAIWCPVTPEIVGQ